MWIEHAIGLLAVDVAAGFSGVVDGDVFATALFRLYQLEIASEVGHQLFMQ